MKRVIVVATLAAAVSALSCSGSSSPCGKGTDCKGARLCVQGACVDPDAGSGRLDASTDGPLPIDAAAAPDAAPADVAPAADAGPADAGPDAAPGADGGPAEAGPDAASAGDAAVGDAGAPPDARGDAPICATGYDDCGGTCTSTDTDPVNCGACGIQCLAPAICTSGHCVTVLDGTLRTNPIAVLDGTIYWTYQQILYGLSTAGGTPQALKFFYTAVAFTTAGDTLYFADSAGSDIIAYNGATSLVASEYGAEIAVDGSTVYWANGGTGDINAQAIGSSTVQHLVTSQVDPWGVAVSGGTLYWSTSGRPVAGTIMKQTLPGGAPVLLATDRDYPGFIATDGVNVCWSDSVAILAVAVAGGAPTRLATVSGAPRFVVDSGFLYWASGSLWRVPTSGGGAPVALFGGSPNGAIATDAASVYWVDQTLGLLTMAK